MLFSHDCCRLLLVVYYIPNNLISDEQQVQNCRLQFCSIDLLQIGPSLLSCMSADMASDGSLSVVVSTSPKHGNRDAETVRSSSPKGQCLCSPTMHQGSFRCRLHRSTSSAWMKRSKSMPADHPVASLSSKESLGSS
ncbi:hypothetical protein SDJN02_08772 [Cucurbita argyrosperma subsp. argyrosperma]|nr:hypothetical protein SDJN02_08772 [Cucurbita argyrosperma subsp. argyrosperma]